QLDALGADAEEGPVLAARLERGERLVVKRGGLVQLASALGHQAEVEGGARHVPRQAEAAELRQCLAVELARALHATLRRRRRGQVAERQRRTGAIPQAAECLERTRPGLFRLLRPPGAHPGGRGVV